VEDSSNQAGSRKVEVRNPRYFPPRPDPGTPAALLEEKSYAPEHAHKPHSDEYSFGSERR